MAAKVPRPSTVPAMVNPVTHPVLTTAKSPRSAPARPGSGADPRRGRAPTSAGTTPPTPTAPAIVAMPVRHQARYVRSAARWVRRVTSMSDASVMASIVFAPSRGRLAQAVPLRHILRAIVVVILDACALLALSAILPGFE